MGHNGNITVNIFTPSIRMDKQKWLNVMLCKACVLVLWSEFCLARLVIKNTFHEYIYDGYQGNIN